MTVTTVRPDSVRSGSANYSNVGGAASHAAALADNNAATYIRKSASGTASIILNCGTFSLLSTQAIKQVRLQVNYESTQSDSKANVQLGVRAAPTGSTTKVNYFGPAYQIRGVDALGTYAAPWYTTAPNGSSWTQALLNDVLVQVTDYRDGTSRAYLYEVLVDVDVANAPTTTVSSPSGTITTTSTPSVAWSYTDADGDAQAYYQVRVFTAAQYGIAGFDPSTSPAAWESGQVASADTTAAISTYLANSTTYRAYVRTGKTLNGQPFWSAWAYSGFSLSLTPPTTPTVTATWQSASNRVALVVTGSAPTGYDSQTFQVQRSDDGGTSWVTVRDCVALVSNGSYVATAYDYEAPRGATASYRARSVGVLGDNEVSTAWSSTASAVTTNDGAWWLKAVSEPSLNRGAVQVLSDPEETLGEATGVFQPIGRDEPVVITGGMSGITGSYDIATSGASEWDAVYALLTHTGTMLVQTPFGDQRYIRVLERSWSREGSTTTPRRTAKIKYVQVSGA